MSERSERLVTGPGSELRERLSARLARYDDEALVALANRGLLRRARKDLERDPGPILVSEEDGAVLVELGGHRIRFDESGPAGARCTCPAGGVCQHLLAAVLVLAAQAVAPSDTAPSAVAPSDAAAADPAPSAETAAETADGTADTVTADGAAASVVDELALISQQTLWAHAGKAGYRWAWELVGDLEQSGGITFSGAHHLVISFARPAITVRYLGGPLEAMVADPAPKPVERYRVAAALAFRRARGLPVEPPEPRRGAPDGDPASASTLAGQLTRSRERLRAEVGDLASDCLRLGLSHLSSGTAERCAALATWAEGARYYRMALGLRRLTDHVGLLLERHASADEERLLDELGVTVALTRALSAAAADGREPVHLTGRSRDGFDDTAPLRLAGLGAQPWRSASGYVGLTCVFWSFTESRFRTWTDARPVALGGLDPVARYRSAGPWPGCSSPEALTGRGLVLTGARVSERGRISGVERTAALLTAEPVADLVARLPVTDSWENLLTDWSARRRSLLAQPDPAADWAVLAPATLGRPVFDPARHVLTWPLMDGTGRVLPAELAFSDLTEPAIARLERLSVTGPAAGTLVVARLGGRLGEIIAEPLSLIHPASGGPSIEALAFPSGGPDAPADRLGGRFHRVRPQSVATAPAEPAKVEGIPEPLRELRRWLVRTAERGIGPSNFAAADAELDRLCERAGAVGLTAFDVVRPAGGQATSALPATVDRLLRVTVLYLQYEHLLVTANQDVETEPVETQSVETVP